VPAHTEHITNWGRYPSARAEVRHFRTEAELRSVLGALPEAIPRGMGRCYGDSALAAAVISTLKFNRMLGFDAETGLLTCEAGVTFDDILRVFVPRGWFLPVTPGTRFITVGGAIASDVHGKNHHRAGSFSNHLHHLDLLLADGRVLTCSRTENAALFQATCGGMGLTGLVLRAAFTLQPIETAFIVQETVRAPDLDAIMDLFEASAGWTYSMARIDCLARGRKLGRSVLFRGEHARLGDLAGTRHAAAPLDPPRHRRLTMPVDLPGFVLNPFTVRLFNACYFAKARPGVHRALIDYDPFFSPLDGIRHWNRIYGRRGFTQYQFVLPRAASHAGLTRILEEIARRGQGSFLAVLKLFGPQEGLISFPREGYTLALDFPVAPGLFDFLDGLDRIVLDHGGRLYLTKDARMSRAAFVQGYPGARTFEALKHRVDPRGRFQSLQSKRLMDFEAAAQDAAPSEPRPATTTEQPT
jgi:FAD/FMN-containing dehydrogenase